MSPLPANLQVMLSTEQEVPDFESSVLLSLREIKIEYLNIEIIFFNFKKLTKFTFGTPAVYNKYKNYHKYKNRKFCFK